VGGLCPRLTGAGGDEVARCAKLKAALAELRTRPCVGVHGSDFVKLEWATRTESERDGWLSLGRTSRAESQAVDLTEAGLLRDARKNWARESFK